MVYKEWTNEEDGFLLEQYHKGAPYYKISANISLTTPYSCAWRVQELINKGATTPRPERSTATEMMERIKQRLYIMFECSIDEQFEDILQWDEFKHLPVDTKLDILCECANNVSNLITNNLIKREKDADQIG